MKAAGANLFGTRYWLALPKFSCLIAALGLILTGCQTIEPAPQQVHIPVAASCLPPVLPQRPAIATEAELAALDDYRFTLEIFIDRRKLLGYVGELEAVMHACR